MKKNKYIDKLPKALQKEDKAQTKKQTGKKILLVLLIISILACFGVGGYYIYINIMNGNIKIPIFTEVPKETTTITLTKVDRNLLTINAQSEVGISKLTYDLNSTQAQVIQFSGETYIEETIEMPIGENVIYVSIVDVNGEEITKEETMIVEAPKPIIDLSVVGNNIKITITSEVELSEIRYKWNEENEKKENMITYEEKMSFEKQLEIPIGQNTLTIVATDINGGITEKNQVIKGVTKATTSTIVQGEYLHFTVVGKENIEKVEFEFNGKKYLMNTDTFGETKTVHYKVKLVEGMNYLTITSTTQSGGTDTTTYEQEYTK